MKLISIQAEMTDGARRQIQIVMPDNSSGRQIEAEFCRKLRDRFHVMEAVERLHIVQQWPTNLPAFS